MFKPKPGYRCVAWSADGDLVVFVHKGKGARNSAMNVWYCFIWDRRSDSRIQLPTLPSFDLSFRCIVVPTQPYLVQFFEQRTRSYIWAQPSSLEWQTCNYDRRVIDMDTGYCDAVSFKPRDMTTDHSGGLIILTKGGLLYTPNQQSDLMAPNPTLMCQRRLVPIYNQEVVPDAECFLLERKLPCSWEVWKIDISRRELTSVHDLSGLTVFLSSDYSIAYKSDSELERNCIYFTTEEKEDARRLSIFVFRLDDQSMSLVQNQHHARFPFCLAQITDSGMPWIPYLKFVDKDKQQNTIVVTTSAGTATDTMQSSCSMLDGSCDLKIEANIHCELSHDLQRLIADLLPSTDYANIRLVSRNWSRLPAICWQPDFSKSVSTQFPLLMVVGEKDKQVSIIDPASNMTYFISSEELLDCKIRYSNDGWLLVTQGKSMIFFYEPISKTKIKLIDVPLDFNIHAISFSSSPTSTSDWVVIAVSCMPENVYVAHLRPCYDKWIIEPCGVDFIPYGCNPIFHDGNLYILDVEGKIIRLSFRYSESKMSCTYDSEHMPPMFSDFRRWFLVSCGGKLHIVIIGLLGKFVKVCSREEWNWVEVKDIGNFSIFISQTSSFAVPVRETAKRNTINFPLFDENKYVCYKLDEGVFKLYHGGESTIDIYQRKELFNGTWLQPKATKGYRS